MRNANSVSKITNVRHAVMVLVRIQSDLAWLRSQLVKHTAGNIRARYRSMLRSIERNPTHAGALAILDRMAKENAAHQGGLGDRSLAAYLCNVMLHDTYVWTGTGASAPVRMGWVWTIIDRARQLTIGTDQIDWFLDGVAAELMRFVGDDFHVEAILTLDHVTANSKRSDAIRFVVSRKLEVEPTPEDESVSSST